MIRTDRIIKAMSQSMETQIRVAMGSDTSGMLTGTRDIYNFVMCRHQRRYRRTINLLSGTRIGYLCLQCDTAVYVDNLDQLIRNETPPLLLDEKGGGNL